MEIKIRPMSAEEIGELNERGMPGDALAKERMTVEATGQNGQTGKLFVDSETVELLGEEYIASHTVLEYDNFCEEWFLRLSQNDHYNNLKINPQKLIEVRFVEEKRGEHTEVWKSIETGAYYLRMLCNEPFARWMTCGSRTMGGFVDKNEVRPNVVFKNGDQTEGVRYNDWNGTAAYADSFNPHFRGS